MSLAQALVQALVRGLALVRGQALVRGLVRGLTSVQVQSQAGPAGMAQRLWQWQAQPPVLFLCHLLLRSPRMTGLLRVARSLTERLTVTQQYHALELALMPGYRREFAQALRPSRPGAMPSAPASPSLGLGAAPAGPLARAIPTAQRILHRGWGPGRPKAPTVAQPRQLLLHLALAQQKAAGREPHPAPHPAQVAPARSG